MSDPYLSAWSSQFAAVFFGVFFAFSKWSLVLYVTFVHSKDMSKPLYSVALWSSRRVLHLRLFRPEDAAYFSETPIVKSNNPIHISFYYMPAFWVMRRRPGLTWQLLTLTFVFMLYWFDSQMDWSLANTPSAFPSLALMPLCAGLFLLTNLPKKVMSWM